MPFKYIRFLFVGEGSSDEGLIEPLRGLCYYAGADEVVNATPTFDQTDVGHKVIAKLQAVFQQEPNVDIIFVHRDADSPDHHPREAEIQNAVIDLGINIICIPVIPIQATEAWALLDEQAIREVVRNPASKVDLALPRPQQVEHVGEPKRRLQEVLLIASESSGKRRIKARQEFHAHRRELLERLTPDSPVRDVPAWQRLVAAIQDALQRL